MNLNIVFLDFDDIKNPLLSAGQAHATVEVGKRLAKKGHTISVLSSKYPGYKDRKENGLQYKHIGLGSGNIKLNNLIYIVVLPFYVKSIKADIIIECFTAPISTMFSPLFTKIPVVGLPTSFEAARFSKLYHLPFDVIEKFGLKHYRYVMPYTNDMKKEMLKVNPALKTKVVGQGVDALYTKIKKKTPKYILYLGRYDISQKGLDLLLKAYALTDPKNTLPLAFYGHGSDENTLRETITNLKLSSRVSVHKGAYDKKKEEVLSHASSVAFPSRHEGFSLFSLEALASGLPLISFAISGLSWTNNKVNLKAKPFNIKEYANLLTLGSNIKKVNEMGKNAREFAKHYSWDSVASQFESFFTDIVSGAI